NGLRYKKVPDYSVDFVFTTQRGDLLKKYKGKKIHLCYGVGLTTYSFSESRESIDKFDLKIVHGDISYDAVKERKPSIELIKAGYLRYSRWRGVPKYIYGSEEKKSIIKTNNSLNKPVLLYFPTWGKASSIDMYAKEIQELKKEYFIITKAHHCTYRLESERKHREIIDEISDVVLEGNFSFENAAQLGNIAICDAISGAATEVPFLRKNIKLVLLFSPMSVKNQYKTFINRYACIVKEKDGLSKAVAQVYYEDSFIAERVRLIDKLYSPDMERALSDIKKYIFENTDKSKRR
ncbi:hypothetical protein, partial [Anaerovibrio lipolyticus]|uniref:hypothetical protein n=1 Tax=Anaerovibrio lipolyticus TaxID=82374 RepID=UPI0023EFC129